MENNTNQIDSKITLLKESRLELLRLHKVLVDIERESFEKTNGPMTSGEFLNLLLNEQSLQWLRKFSTLIVDIDEMLDFDDGFSGESVDRHLSEMRKIANLKTSDEEFNDKFKGVLQANREAESKNNELKELLGKE